MSWKGVFLIATLPVLAPVVVGEEPPPDPPDPPPVERPADPVELPDLPGLNVPGMVPPWAKGDTPDTATADEIQIQTSGERLPWGGEVEFVILGLQTLPEGAKGHYLLRDDLGRVIFSNPIALAERKPDAEGARRFSLPAYQPVTAVHTLDLMLDLPGMGRISRVCTFRLRRSCQWDRWLTLLHAPYSKGHWDVLEMFGVHGGMAYRLNEGRRTALRSAGKPYYVENVARSFLARYRSEKGLWERTVARALEDAAGTGALIREPSLWDRRAAEAYVRELQRHARTYQEDRPLFYSLASEPSMTCLSAAFDFDFHPDAVAEYRRWLARDVFGTLKALNASWGTKYDSFDQVQPMRTGEALARLKAGNLAFGPWMAFRAFQDATLAKALREGGRILRETDPQARVGITGALGPSAFGGWDWSRLAQALDVCEAYDIGCAKALWRDLAPGKPALNTLLLRNDPKQLPGLLRAMWSTALEGGPRGVLLWDEVVVEGKPQRLLLTSDGNPSPVAVALGPTLRELSGPMGHLLARGRREPAKIGLLYSPASVRMHWLLEAARLHPKDWLKAWGANTAAERCESAQLRLRVSWAALLSDLGLPWRFISSTELERGRLDTQTSGLRVLVLPRTMALSDTEVAEIKSFVSKGGIVIADALCGRFNGQGVAREKPPLDHLFGVDTHREPYAPEPPHPLETIRNASEAGTPPHIPDELRVALPPAHSDKPVWIGDPPAVRSEYHRSPVLVLKKHGVGATLYLNLNLADYLNWRLHPKNPRGGALRRVLSDLALAPVVVQENMDVKAAELPPGTEIVRLRLSPKLPGARIMALRRRPQVRLHELGLEGDTNAAFDQAMPFKLVWRRPVWVSDLRLGGKPEERKELKGTLDPVTPSLFAVLDAVPPGITIRFTGVGRPGKPLVVKIAQGKGGRLFAIDVKGPDGLSRPYYGATVWAPEGNIDFTIPLASSDVQGEWIVAVKEWSTGTTAQATLQVAAEKK